MSILRKVEFEQADFMWQYQLRYERDVVAQVGWRETLLLNWACRCLDPVGFLHLLLITVVSRTNLKQLDSFHVCELHPAG